MILFKQKINRIFHQLQSYFSLGEKSVQGRTFLSRLWKITVSYVNAGLLLCTGQGREQGKRNLKDEHSEYEAKPNSFFNDAVWKEGFDAAIIPITLTLALFCIFLILKLITLLQ